MRKFTHKIKKGFTLVELVVVIAIVAILGAVSVVGYFAFIEKANKSADEQLCAQYNTLLKAQSALDDDITLPELVTLIEENGIRANQFQTTSKDYTFAYHKAGAEVVLLDSVSGTVLYPSKDKAVPASELWGSMEREWRPVPGISNYALFESVVYSGQDLGGDYTFDLNNHSMRFTAAPVNTMTIDNGTLSVTDKAFLSDQKLVKLEHINVLDDNNGTLLTNKKESHASAKAFFKQKYDESTVKEGEYTVVSDIFISKDNSISTNDNLTRAQCILPAGKVIIENSTFDNVRLETPGDTTSSYIIRNCKFYNNDSYALFSTSAASIEFTGNVVSGCRRGIAVSFGTGRILIDNNTFTLAALKTQNNNERKDNAVQIMAGKGKEIFNNWAGEDFTLATGYANTGITVTNNKVTKAQALFTLHDGWAELAETANQGKGIKDTLFTADRLTISGNTLAANVGKFNADPGLGKTLAKDQYKDTAVQRQTNYDNLKDALISLIK